MNRRREQRADMKVIIDLDRLSQYFVLTGPWDLHKKNGFSYRQNLRDAHHLTKLGLIEITQITPSLKRGKDKIFYQITPFGKLLYNHFESSMGHIDQEGSRLDFVHGGLRE